MAHIHEKIDFTVETFVVHQQTVLLRKHDKYKMWLSVGGHIELDEDPNEAAVREVKEEVGLDVTLYRSASYSLPASDHFRDLIAPQFVNRHHINETHEHVTLVYFAASDTNTLTLSETEKSDECKWFTKQELEDPTYEISEHVKLYARTALDALR